MPEIRNLDDFVKEYTKPGRKTTRLEIEYYADKKQELAKVCNAIRELAGNKKDIPFNLINELLRCFPYLPSVDNMPYEFAELRWNEMNNLMEEIKGEFSDWKIDWNKNIPKAKEKVLDSFLGHSDYVDTPYKGHTFSNFILLNLLYPYYEKTSGLSVKEKRKIIGQLFNTICDYEILKGKESKAITLTGSFAHRLKLLPNPAKIIVENTKGENRRALKDRTAYALGLK